MTSSLLLPRWLTVVITLLLLWLVAYQSALLLWRFFTPQPVVVTPVLSPQTPVEVQFSPLRFSLQTDQQASKTTQPADSSSADRSLPTTILTQWQLVGTYLAPNTALALIKTLQGSYVVEIGQAIENKAVLQHITQDRVVLTVAGKPVELQLADHSLVALKDHMLDYDYATPIRPGYSITNQQSVPKAHLNAFKTLAWKTIVSEGQLAYQILANNATEQALLQSYGLQVSDIILSINGQPLTPALIKLLAFEKKIKAKIKRNGTIQTIEINLMPETPENNIQ